MSGYFGRGEAIGHVGEVLQGVLPLNGVLEPFLVTLPAQNLRAAATAWVQPEWSVEPAWKLKALRAARIAAEDWGVREALRVVVESLIPVARGFGSSTADCVAAIRAVATLAGRRCGDDEIARLAVRAEGASDSTMFGMRPVVFLPARGECLEVLDGEWPAVWVAATDLGGADVETDAVQRPQYSCDEVEEFEELLDRVRVAFRRRDVKALASVATRSAAIHQRHRPHMGWSELRQRAASSGAAGVAVSHSGSAAALLFEHAPLAGVKGTLDVDCPGGWR